MKENSHSSSDIQIVKVAANRQLKKFVTFPWKVYKNDPHWVPPLISSQLARLNSQHNPFFQQGEADIFMAMREDQIVGTIVPWMNHRTNTFLNMKVAGFGFFESIDDFHVSQILLQTACEWARKKDATIIRGPLYFSPQDSPGVIVKGFEQPPPLMCPHTPPYYAEFLERSGFQKHRDAFAYRIDLHPFQHNTENLPSKLVHVANAVQERYHVEIRNLRIEDWNEELKSAMFIFNDALGYQREGVPMEENEFMKLASDLRHIVDPKLVFFAEVNNRPVGLYVALPNINQVLQKINGRLFPFGWLKLSFASRYVSMACTKILGILDEYRNKGIDALFYMKIAEELMKRGHEWIDYSLVAEENKMANRLVQRLGGKIYKICRTYQLNL